jgi:hypothetical protein
VLTVRRDAEGIRIEASAYRLSFPAGRPFCLFAGSDGTAWAELLTVASLHTEAGLDDTALLHEPGLQEEGATARVVIAASSSQWESRALVFECADDLLTVHAEVTGHGRLTEVHLLGGYYSGDTRIGSGAFMSRAWFQSIFSPEPIEHERRIGPQSQSRVIDIMGGSMPGWGHWHFTPAPFIYAASRSAPPEDDSSLPDGEWLAIGLAAQPGEHQFTAFHYLAIEEAFSLRLDYEGQTEVDGTFRSPKVVLQPGSTDPYESVARHSLYLRQAGLVEPEAAGSRPDWWSRPIFCGWGEQSYLSLQAQGDQRLAPAFCRQELYDESLATLEAHDIRPGTIVIDDKWQLEYGTSEVDTERWPDLSGWIARRHARDQRVLLWWKAWDPDGIPAEECVRNAAGKPVAVDPTNPAYEARLRGIVRRMLSDEGYGADGLKVDFTGRTPSGPGLTRCGREWGVELLHRLLAIIHDEAHATMPDAMVIHHAPNPYFAPLADVIRLNDINPTRPVVPQMVHRARVVGAACPGQPIDTDDSPMPDRAGWRDYMGMKDALGIPALYYATHIYRGGEPLEELDYQLIRDSFARWQARAAA